MFSFLSIDYLLQILIFLIGSFLAFYIPGNVFVRRLKLDSVASITISIVLGISLWALQGFIFGFLNIRELTYIYLGIFIIYWIWINLRNFRKIKIKPLKKPGYLSFLIILVLIIGISLQLFSIIWNYFPLNGGLMFIAGAPDNLYHAALVFELIKNFPPLEPGVYNAPIFNYHFLSNLLVADFSRIFKVNYLFLDFHFFVIFLTILFGLSVYSFGKSLNIGKKYILLLLIIIYFVGDFLPYLMLITKGSINFTYSTLENPLSLWISFSRYIGIVLYFSGLTVLVHWIKTKNKFSGLIFAIIFGSIIGFKVYIGVLALIGLFALSLYYLYKKKYSSLFPSILALIISLILYLPINKNAGGFVFTGFWRFEDFIANSYWGLSKLELARYVYLQSNNYFKVYLYDFFYIFIYVIFSIGFLLTGFFNTKSSLKNFPKELHIFLIPGLIVTTVLAFFFIQTSGGANSFQFTISIYIIGSIYAALALNRISKSSNKIFIIIVTILILFSFTRVIGTSFVSFNKLLGNTGIIFINSNYLDTIKFLKQTPLKSSLVLTDPSIGNNCIFVKLISNKSIFYCDAAGPGDKGLIDVKQKKGSIHNMLYDKTELIVKHELELNNISYILATKSAYPKFFKEIYSNNEYQILILNK